MSQTEDLLNNETTNSFSTIKEQIQSLIDRTNSITGSTATNLTDGINVLIERCGKDIIPAEDVAFLPEHIDTSTLYTVEYNWFADAVSQIQDMVGSNKAMNPADILYWLKRVKYIPQAMVETEVDLRGLTPSVSVSTKNPDVSKSSANTVVELFEIQTQIQIGDQTGN